MGIVCRVAGGGNGVGAQVEENKKNFRLNRTPSTRFTSARGITARRIGAPPGGNLDPEFPKEKNPTGKSKKYWSLAGGKL